MLQRLDDRQIEVLLSSETFGRVGCFAAGRAYVLPITYAYAEGSVYAHSGEGMALRLLRENPRVTFEVERFDDPAHFRCVSAWGSFEELGGAEASHGLDVLSSRLRPAASPGSEAPRPAPNPIVFRIRLEEKSGRSESRDPD